MKFNQPLSANDMPRAGGIASMMRLPQHETAEGLDACFIGVPMDIGVTNRAGTRFGPRAIRAESCLLRPYNISTGAAPFESLQVGDVGDVAINTFNLRDAVRRIREAYEELLLHPVRPITLGGDHSITYPILQAVAKTRGPVALVHIDAHADITDEMFGEKITHGTPFRRAFDEGLIRPELTFQIGLRGTGYSTVRTTSTGRHRPIIGDGFTVIPAAELTDWGRCWLTSRSSTCRFATARSAMRRGKRPRPMSA